jgi:hypothetical protein
MTDFSRFQIYNPQAEKTLSRGETLSQNFNTPESGLHFGFNTRFVWRLALGRGVLLLTGTHMPQCERCLSLLLTAAASPSLAIYTLEGNVGHNDIVVT